MLDTRRIQTRIKEARRRILVLEKQYQEISEDEFVGDGEKNANAERHLQIAIQACIDIAGHIVATLGLHHPMKETADVFFSLAEEDIIPKDFAKVMKKMTGYRNILVHGYTDVDPHKTYDYIQSRLSDIAQFVKYIEEFLEKQEKKK